MDRPGGLASCIRTHAGRHSLAVTARDGWRSSRRPCDDALKKMRKPLAQVTEEELRRATAVVLCNVGHTKSLPVAGKNASPALLASSSAAIKPETLFIVVRSKTDCDQALVRLRQLRQDVLTLDENAWKIFTARL